VTSDDKRWVDEWRRYLDGYPSDFPTEPLKHALTDLTRYALLGCPSHQEANQEVAKLIVEKLKELGEPECPTSQSAPRMAR
jgi:hypothetical protein